MRLLEEGQVIRDTYEVERFLGEGAFAEVYRVRHRFLGRQAMKVFKRVGMDIKEIEEMLGEAILLSQIGHPNIVRVFDANVLQSTRGICGYFTMENIPGGSLDKFWRSHGTKIVPVETAVDLTKQVCRGISLAHREKPPIVHRDIKPQNIIRQRDGEIFLVDFGAVQDTYQNTVTGEYGSWNLWIYGSRTVSRSSCPIYRSIWSGNNFAFSLNPTISSRFTTTQTKNRFSFPC